MIFVSIDSKWKSSLPETLISIFVLSEITMGLAFKLWGEIGVRISELLFGETIGPPQLNEYPVEPELFFNILLTFFLTLIGL